VNTYWYVIKKSLSFIWLFIVQHIHVPSLALLSCAAFFKNSMQRFKPTPDLEHTKAKFKPQSIPFRA
jgi:hypothetical protein